MEGWAASTSIENLGSELVRDLSARMADSLNMDAGAVRIQFDDSDYGQFLGMCQLLVPGGGDSLKTTVQVDVLSLTLEVNEGEKSQGNLEYRRRLKVAFTAHSGSWSIHGKQSTGDRISRSEIRQMMREPFPGEIQGDFRQRVPGMFKIALASTLVFALASSLFFVRTAS